MKYQVYGIDKNPEHIKSALKLGIIDKETDFSDLKDIEVVIIAVPVNHIAEVSQKVLDNISDEALVLDVGSVKNNICETLKKAPKRQNFVAAHPLAGTEFSGPEAAIENLFDEKVTIICESEKKQIGKP